MKTLFHLPFAILCSFALIGCASLDTAIYGSPEKAQEAREESNARAKERDVEKWKAMEDELFYLIVDYRKANRKPVFPQRDSMRQLARIRAKELSVSYSKYRPNGRGLYTTLAKEVEGELKGSNGGYELRARNITDPQRVFKEWINKEDTRKILLNSSLVRFGIGVYRENPYSTLYWSLSSVY